MRTPRFPSLALSVPLLLAVAAPAQHLPRVGHVAAYGYVSPTLDNPAAEPAVGHEHVVHRPGASFLGLCLRDVVLGPGSRIEIRSRLDGDTDVVTAETWSTAGPWTAYLNGDTVDVRLVAGKGTAGNRFTIASVAIGSRGLAEPATLCHANDTRALWVDARICRLLLNDGVGVATGTGWLIDYKGRLVTAGHVLQHPNLQSIKAEFNVPRSNADGTIVNPSASSQYSWNPELARRASENTANGPDWGVFEILPNTVTMLFAGEAQRAIFTLQSPASSMTEAYVTGYGIDDTPDLTYNKTLQTARGPVSWFSSTYELRYRVDTMSGVSGGPVTNAATGFAIGVHEGGACTTEPTTYNLGWGITLPAFQTQRDRISPDLPDLLPRSFSPPQRVATDNRYNIGAQVANLGRKPAGSMRAGIYLSNDESITTADILLASLAFPAFAAGQGGTLGTTFVVPGTVAPGSYWIGVLVDDQDAVAEGDEKDNARSRPIEVYRGKADLIAGVDAATFPGPGVYQPGQGIAAPIWVTNRGEAAAPASVTAVIHTGNVALPLDNHIVLALIPTPALNPNQTWQMTVPVTIPWCAANRAGDIGCFADADEVIGEISESNNFGTYTSRGIGNYSGPERRIAYHPMLRTGARTQDTATFRSLAGGDTASICVLRGTADQTAQHYLLIWSFQPSPFVLDSASNVSLMLLNGPVFTRWFSLIHDANVYRAQLTFPKLKGPLTMTVWTHALYLDSRLQPTGWVPIAIKNQIVP